MAIPGDNPIRSSDEDLLGRNQSAAEFAEHILSLDTSEGLVAGVLGAWGSGKTSFVNLTRSHLKTNQAAIIDFNPWMFSGTDQLVQSFFIEIASQLKLRPGLDEVGEAIENYGDVFSGLGWLPIAGPWIERFRGGTKAVAKLLQARKEGIGDRRARVTRELHGLDIPIVVVVDDIDRLNSSEIREIFKLIRLTASFPNVIYVVAFDRLRVEQALGEDGVPGRAYLEKIVQVTIDLPAVPINILNSQLLQAIDGSLSGLDVMEVDQFTWPDIYAEVIWPLVTDMRDARRYAASIHGTVRRLGDRVAIADVLGLEAVRMFLPDVYRLLPVSIGALTTPADLSPRRVSDTSARARVDALIVAGGERADVVKAMIERLFMAGSGHLDGGTNYGGDWQSKWLRSRRVAHPDVLSLYLEGVEGDRLVAFGHAERLYGLIGDRKAFSSYLDAVPADQLGDVISSLEVYEDQYRAEHVVPVSIALLNSLPRLPEKPRTMFSGFGERTLIKRVVLRLLWKLGDDHDAVESAVERILAETRTLSAQLDLIALVGHQENAGSRLVTEEVDAKFQRGWRARVRAASANQLIDEKELLSVLYRAIDKAEPGEGDLIISREPEMTLAVLRSAQSEVLSQSMGSRATGRSPRLHWDVLVKLYRSEDVIAERVEQLRDSEHSSEEPELLSLVEKYLGGWRPREL